MRGFYNARQLARVLTNRLAISDSSILDKPTRLWRSYHGVMNVKYLNLLSRYESNAVQFLPNLAIQSRYFSSGANEYESAPTEAVKEIYDKMLNSILEKRSAPPNALLWSMIKECASEEDIKLLFDVLHKLRRFRLSNLRISDNFNDALCLEVTKACVRVQCIDYGKKTLWKHNLYGLTPLIGSAHQLLLYAKQNKDVRLMQDVMDLVKKNNLPLQSGSADIVFGICYDANNWDLLSKYARRFVKAGVKFRQTSINILMDFAAKTDTLTEAFKQQPENAAGVIELLTQTLPDQKTQITSRLEELVTEWPIEVIKMTENKKAHFALNCRRFHSTSTSRAPCRALHDVFVPHVVRPPNSSGVSLPRSHSPFYRLLSTSSVNQSGGSGGSSEANSNAGNAENQSGGSGGSSKANSNAGNAENPGGGSQKTAEQGKPVRGSPVSWMSFLLLLATGVALVLYYDREKKRHMEGINNASKAVKEGPSVGKAAIGGPFNLVDHTGKPVTEKNFVGKWTIFYFGFTHCPDICPEELQKLAVAIDKIKDKSGIQVVPVFISVDPERDNVEQVREYVKEFHPDLIGLTGSADEVKKVARAYRVYYMKTEEEGSDYLVDHSIVMYLMDPKMEFVKFFGKNNDADTLTEGVIKEIKQHKKVTA